MKKLKNILIVLLFCAVSLFVSINHEPWADEAQSWLIARDSSNLLAAVRYEVTPGLWHLILYPFAKAGFPYPAAQIIHFFIILAAVIIFLAKAPFTRLQKILFIFGYYILYEYDVIVRNYALTVMLLFLIAACYEKRFKKPAIYSLLLILLANCNLHSLIMALVLGCFYWYEFLFQEKKSFTKKQIIPALILLAGISVSVFQLLPPPDASSYRMGLDVSMSNKTIAAWIVASIGAFMPIPLPQLHFWNSKLFFLGQKSSIIFYALPALLAFMLVSFTFIFLLKFRKFFTLYLFLYLGLIIPFLLKHKNVNRHEGLLFIAFIFVVWLARQNKNYQNQTVPAGFNPEFLNNLLTVMLFFHVIAASLAVYYEVKYPFSSGKNIAYFLEKNNFIGKDTLIITYPSLSSVAVLPYIHNKDTRFFCLESQRFCSFIVLDKTFARNRVLKKQDIKLRISELLAKEKTKYNNVIFMSNETYMDEDSKLLYYSSPAIAQANPFYVYRFESKREGENSGGVR